MQDDDAGFDLTGWSDAEIVTVARTFAGEIGSSVVVRRTDGREFCTSASVAALLRELAARIEGRTA